MIITVSINSELNKRLLIEAKKDGHNSRSAIIRKAVTLFLDEKARKSKKKQN